MSLIVEDGTGTNPNADSYISEADAITRATALGLDFPASDADAEVPLRRAAIYLESYRNKYQGIKYVAGQALQWPRNPVYIDEILNDPSVIPTELIDAQIVLASVECTNGNLFGTALGGVGSRSVGDVSVTSNNGGSADNSAYSGLANELIAPLLKNPSLGGLEFNVSRA